MFIELLDSCAGACCLLPWAGEGKDEHDSTLTFISPVAHCVASGNASVDGSVISTAGRNLRSLTLVRDDNALNNALQHSFSRQRKKNRSGNLVISNRKRSKKHLLITTSLGRL